MTAWVDVAGWMLLHFVWQGTLIALAAAALLWLLRRAAAQARYVVACLALVAAMLSPLATIASRAGLFSIPIVGSPSATTETAVASPSTPTAAGVRSALAAPAARVVAGAAAVAQSQGVAAAFPVLVGVWMVGVLLLTLRLAFGLARIRRIRAAALADAPSRWRGVAERVSSTLGIRRAIHVVDSTLVETPMVIGWLRPVVLLPVAALANLTPEQVQAIIAHELAHIRRHDFAVNLLQTLAETLLFYHPAIWWLSSRIRIEREHCCDDIAVAVCGDPATYVEALAELASAAPGASALALAATGGSLLDRARRLLRTDVAVAGPQRKAPIVIAATILVIVVVGTRFMLVAQSIESRQHGTDRPGLGPGEINEILGFKLFPGAIHYVTDDPHDALAWDVKVSFPGGEMPFIGFTARSLIRYAYDLPGMPIMDGPAWLDRESLSLHATTPATGPDADDVRLALRTAFEQQFGLAFAHSARRVPIYSMVTVDPNGTLGPEIHPSTVACLEGRRQRPAEIGPTLVARGQLATLCGIDNSFTTFKGYRVTLSEFAASWHGFGLDTSGLGREIVNDTGHDEPFDFTLRLGIIPLAAIATVHPDMALPLRGLGVHTFQEAIERQLGLRLEPTEGTRDVVVITSARKPA